MIGLRQIAGFLLTATVLSACADGGTSPGSGGSGNISGSVPPAAGASGQPLIVTAVPGQRDVHPVRWEKATAGSDDRVLTVAFWSSPCFHVDHVGLAEEGDRVIVTLYVGVAPSAVNQACIQPAEYRAVKVSLSAPLGSRTVADGAPAAGEGAPGTGTSVNPSPS